MPRTETRLDPQTLIELLARDEPSDEIDDRILQAAARAILRDGPSAFEVDEVAAAARVGRSTVYRRFGDRNGLLVSALAHEGRRLLDLLAETGSPIGELSEEIASAFCTGVRFASLTQLADLARRDSVLLHLLTVDSAPLVAAASEHLADLAQRRHAGLDRLEARRSAEVLVRLALSFTLSIDTSLGTSGDVDEEAVRRHVVGLVGVQLSPRVVAAPTS